MTPVELKLSKRTTQAIVAYWIGASALVLLAAFCFPKAVVFLVPLTIAGQLPILAWARTELRH